MARFWIDGEPVTPERAEEYVMGHATYDGGMSFGVDPKDLTAIWRRAVTNGPNGEDARDLLSDILPLLEIAV